MNTMTKCWLAVIVTFVPVMAVAYDSSLGACSSTNPYFYGDTGPDGGIVFYLEEACSGMEAQPYDVGANSSNAYVGVEGFWDDAISASAAYNNTYITHAIKCPTTTKPTCPFCWHLPTSAELKYLYEQRRWVGGLTFFTFYWSSTVLRDTICYQTNTTHYCDDSALALYNPYADEENVLKNTKFLARAVRAF